MRIELSRVKEFIHLQAQVPTQSPEQFDKLDILLVPGESFGGYSYDELLVIATTRGEMDADELRV